MEKLSKPDGHGAALRRTLETSGEGSYDQRQDGAVIHLESDQLRAHGVIWFPSQSPTTGFHLKEGKRRSVSMNSSPQ